MSSTTGSTADRPERDGHCCWNECLTKDRKGKRGSNWSALNIVAMIVGFMIFWPIGLFMIYWIIKGRSVTEIPGAIQEQWEKMNGKNWHGKSARETDNVVFNEYQQTQYERIREIKDEIKDRARRFTDFRSNAKRRADEEEFNRFMNEAPANGEAG